MSAQVEKSFQETTISRSFDIYYTRLFRTLSNNYNGAFLKNS